MAEQFKEGGIRFQYPENWRLEREDNDSGWTVSLQSPDTAFLMVCLREEYPDLEAEDCVDSLAGQPAVGHDIRFFSFDLTNTCWTRSIYGDTGTLLVLCQANDLELEQHEPVLRAICASLKVEED